jgi:hypothetical protein
MKLNNCIICNNKLKAHQKKCCSSECWTVLNKDIELCRAFEKKEKELLIEQKELLMMEYEIVQMYSELVAIKESIGYTVKIGDRQVKRLLYLMKKLSTG